MERKVEKMIIEIYRRMAGLVATVSAARRHEKEERVDGTNDMQKR
jgi:hypothetical protein